MAQEDLGFGDRAVGGPRVLRVKLRVRSLNNAEATITRMHECVFSFDTMLLLTSGLLLTSCMYA